MRRAGGASRLLPGYRTEACTGLTQDEARALGFCTQRADHGGAQEWIELRLRFAAVKAARTLLSFGANVEVMSPPEVRVDLAAVATEIAELYSNVRLG